MSFFQDWQYNTVEYNISKRDVKLNVSKLNEGLNSFEEFIVYRKGNIIKVYDRICDHNAGKLITFKNEIKCPLHGWKLNPETGKYLNVNCSKSTI